MIMLRVKTFSDVPSMLEIITWYESMSHITCVRIHIGPLFIVYYFSLHLRLLLEYETSSSNNVSS